MDSNVSITPGFRFEHIDTKSDGYYRNIRVNLAQDPIFDTTYYENRSNIRDFILLGSGFSYKPKNNFEIYANISQNYRSVTFSDISIKNPSFRINPKIKDESGQTFDIGIRGKNKGFLRFDINYFALIYNDRIGLISKQVEEIPGYTTVKTERGNIGNAHIKGIESLLDFNLGNLFSMKNKLNSYINFAYANSLYVSSETNGVQGNQVEFTPKYNFKSGLNFGNTKHLAGIQFNYISKQFTDASNATESDITGIIGEIPAYYIIDLSFKFQQKISSIYFGVNNITDNSYFTRRAAGYPGPGIIPSQGRNYYLTIEIKL